MFNMILRYFKRKCVPLKYWDGFEWRVPDPLEKVVVVPV